MHCPWGPSEVNWGRAYRWTRGCASPRLLRAEGPAPAAGTGTRSPGARLASPAISASNLTKTFYVHLLMYM